MARDWESRDDDRRYGEHANQWRTERDWADRASDDARARFDEEDTERRRFMMDNRYRGGMESQRHMGGDDRGGQRFGSQRSFSGRGNPGYDRPWSDSASGHMDRDVYGYPRRQSDDRWQSDHDGRGYGASTRSDHRSGWDPDRGFFERAGDEVASWFGDDDAERRRSMDARYRGRGPKNYTRSDVRIAEDVNDRLADDPHIDASDIEVSVSSGEVTLNGSVMERFAKRHAEDIAERVSGVKHVQNNLRVSAKTSTTETTSGTNRASNQSTEAPTSFRH